MTEKNIRSNILQCTCENKWQDKRYGDKMRVFNARYRNHKLVGYRCVICKREIDV